MHRIWAQDKFMKVFLRANFLKIEGKFSAAQRTVQKNDLKHDLKYRLLAHQKKISTIISKT